MGIGFNQVPGSTPLTALPGTLGQGVLINQPQRVLEFGANPLPPVTSVPQLGGNNMPTLQVTVNGGTSAVEAPHAVFDTGGYYGTLPHEAYSQLAPGATVTVSYNGTPLYSTQQYTTENTSEGEFNSGIIPFLLGPVYISYTQSTPTSTTGATVFDYGPNA
jgi:hypothetical protein